MADLPPSPPSLPTVSQSIHEMFNTLRGGDVVLFKRIYLALWRYLWPLSRVDPVTLGYCSADCLAQVPGGSGVTVTDWHLLCKLYILSSGGKEAINGRNYPFRSGERHRIARLKDLGLVVRTSFDPAHPHLVKPKHISKSYISFTPSGIQFYKAVVQCIHKTAHKDILLLYSGTNKNTRADDPPGR